MRGLGIIKYGKAGKASRGLDFITEDEKPYCSYIDYKTFDDLTEIHEDDNCHNEFDHIKNQDDNKLFDDSTCSVTQSLLTSDDRIVPYKSFHKQVKHTMKLLNFASLEASKTKDVMKSLISLQKTTNASFYSKTKLGSLGACTILVSLLVRYQNDRDLVIEIFKSICDLLNLEVKNKVIISKCGLPNVLLTIYNIYKEDSEVLEHFCKVIIELMNPKFNEMLSIFQTNKTQQHGHKLRSSFDNMIDDFRNNFNDTNNNNNNNNNNNEYKDDKEGYTNMITSMTLDNKEDSNTTTINSNNNNIDTRHSLHTLTSDAKNATTTSSHLWDNRTELCFIGICDILMDILERLKPRTIKKFFISTTSISLSSTNNSITSLESIFEEENVVLVVCSAIASLSSNHTCATIFGNNIGFALNISSLLIISHHSMYNDDIDWDLRIAAVWIIINLCIDKSTNNRNNFGNANVCEHLLKCLADYIYNQNEYLKKSKNFSKLVEYYIWGLLNMILGNQDNQNIIKNLEKYNLLYQLYITSWITNSAKLKLKRIIKLLYKDKKFVDIYENDDNNYIDKNNNNVDSDNIDNNYNNVDYNHNTIDNTNNYYDDNEVDVQYTIEEDG